MWKKVVAIENKYGEPICELEPNDDTYSDVFYHVKDEDIDSVAGYLAVGDVLNVVEYEIEVDD